MSPKKRKTAVVDRDRTAAGTTGIDAKRGAAPLWVFPEDLFVVGRDLKPDGSVHKRGQHVLWQARALLPPDPNLVKAWKDKGSEDPVDVRKNGDKFEVIEGRRRTISARQGNAELVAEGGERKRIEVKLKTGTDLDMRGYVISSNAFKLDVHPVWMAQDVSDFLAAGASEEEAAYRCNKTIPEMRRLLKLLTLDERVQQACVEGVIDPTAAIKLSDISFDEQLKEIDRIKRGESKGTAKEVAGRVKAVRKGEEEATVAPGKRIINKILADKDAVEQLGPEFIAGLRFAMGDLPANRIKHLTAIINRVRGTKSS